MKWSYIVGGGVVVIPIFITFQMSMLARVKDPDTKRLLANAIQIEAMAMVTCILGAIHYYLYRKIIATTVCTFIISLVTILLYFFSYIVIVLIIYCYCANISNSLFTKITPKCYISS